MREQTRIIGLLAALLVIPWAWTAVPARAAEGLQPYVLAQQAPGNPGERVVEVSDALADAGFRLLGRYSPYAGASVVVATRDDLLRAASATERGAYAAVVRVGVTQGPEGVQVTYVNPAYLAQAYRLEDDLSGVSRDLAEALGQRETFGGEPMTAEELRGYHYGFGMEYFDDPYRLADHGSHAEALAAVEEGLEDSAGGAVEVYRLAIPGREQVLFGVAFKAARGAAEYAAESTQMGVVDFRPLKRTAYLPYELLVNGTEVEALHMRFRMAVHFPDLNMMGDHSFMELREAPRAMEEALLTLVGRPPAEEADPLADYDL